MPSFPRSGCLIKLGSEKQGDKVLQVVPPKAGSWPDEVTHQDDEKALLADLCIWYVNKVEDGGVDLVPYHYPDLRLAITDGKVVLDEGQGRKYAYAGSNPITATASRSSVLPSTAQLLVWQQREVDPGPAFCASGALSLGVQFNMVPRVCLQWPVDIHQCCLRFKVWCQRQALEQIWIHAASGFATWLATTS